MAPPCKLWYSLSWLSMPALVLDCLKGFFRLVSSFTTAPGPPYALSWQQTGR